MEISEILKSKHLKNVLVRIGLADRKPKFLEEHSGVPVFDISNSQKPTRLVKYIYADLENEFIYVGITKRGWKIRNTDHIYGPECSLINKKLKANHKILLLIVGYEEEIEELSFWENTTIKNLHCCIYDNKYSKGYNKTFGGDCAYSGKYSKQIFEDQSKVFKAWIKANPEKYNKMQQKAALAKQTKEWKEKARINQLNWIKNCPEDFKRMQIKAKATKQSKKWKAAASKRQKARWTKEYTLNQILKHPGKVKMTCEKDIFDFVNEVNSKLYIGIGFNEQSRLPKYNGITVSKFIDKFLACSRYCNIEPIQTRGMPKISAFGADKYLYDKVFKWRKLGKSFREIKNLEYKDIKRKPAQLMHQYYLVCKRNHWAKL